MSGLKFAATSMALPPVLWASLPSASTTTGELMFCPDAPGGGSMVVSDGALYRVFARGVLGKRVTTGATGAATWTFEQAFPAVPVMSYMIENTGAQPYTVEITALSASAVSVQIRHAQLLPAVIGLATLLQNFNIFGGAALSGIGVHLTAKPATA